MYDINNNTSNTISPNKTPFTPIQTLTPFHYVARNLYLSVKEIKNFRDVDLKQLIKRRKLHLILDLDHTLVAAQELQTPPTEEEKQAMKAMQDKHVIAGGAMYVKLRPGIREFLKKVSIIYDLSIYTMGNREYAAQVVEVLQSVVPSLVVSHVIAREDCLQPKVKSLDVVLVHEHVVLVVDDTEKVWDDPYKRNLISIGRYYGWPEEEDDNELDRVYKILKAVHNVFYDQCINTAGDANSSDNPNKRRRTRDNSGVSLITTVLCSLFNDDSGQIEFYSKRDVRRVLPWVQKSIILCFNSAEDFYLDYDSLD